MKKSSRFLILLALAVTASFSSPKPAAPSTCVPPACLIGPGCCIDRQCGAWCESRGGGIPHCGGNGSGGCCSCEIIE
jgi:hypothetical protein